LSPTQWAVSPSDFGLNLMFFSLLPRRLFVGDVGRPVIFERRYCRLLLLLLRRKSLAGLNFFPLWPSPFSPQTEFGLTFAWYSKNPVPTPSNALVFLGTHICRHFTSSVVFFPLGRILLLLFISLMFCSPCGGEKVFSKRSFLTSKIGHRLNLSGSIFC